MANELEEILDQVDMASYMDREGIHYRETHGSSGKQLNVRECPTCGNSNWKVYLNAASGVGNCFAGDHPPGELFTKWRFIKAQQPAYNGRQLFDHVKSAAAAMGWRAKTTVSAAVERPTDWDLPASIALPHGGRNLPYLDNRGITSEYAAYFHLRYTTPGAYYRYKVYDEKTKTSGWKFQRYERRVIIPVYGIDGKLATFQGRDVTGQQDPKYLFPPMLEGSGVHLYNGFNVVPGVKRVCVGEGAFDVAAMKIAFDTEQDTRDIVPIGTFGKHLSHGGETSQLAKFRHLRSIGLEEVTFMWDSEVAAIDAACEMAKLLVELGLRVRIALLPPDKDPNEVPASEVVRAYYQAVLFTEVNALALRMRVRQGR